MTQGRMRRPSWVPNGQGRARAIHGNGDAAIDNILAACEKMKAAGVDLKMKYFGEEKAELLDRCRSYTLHSDFFVTEPNPLHMIEMAVTRTTWKEPEYVLAPEESVSVESAICAVTSEAAWMMGSEREVGSIVKGKLADFVVLDADPRKVDKHRIKDIAVLETWMNGKQVFKAAIK